MALVIKKTPNFASVGGAPTHATNYDEVDLGSQFTNVKIIVTVATLGISLDGRNSHPDLPIGVHDFLGINISKIYLRRTGATVNLYAYNVDK